MTKLQAKPQNSAFFWTIYFPSSGFWIWIHELAHIRIRNSIGLSLFCTSIKVAVVILRSPGIDSSLAESIPGFHKRLQIRARTFAKSVSCNRIQRSLTGVKASLKWASRQQGSKQNQRSRKNTVASSSSRNTDDNKTHATPRSQATARTTHVNRMLSEGENPRDAET